MRKIYLENYTVSYCGEKVEITGTVNFVEYAINYKQFYNSGIILQLTKYQTI